MQSNVDLKEIFITLGLSAEDISDLVIQAKSMSQDEVIEFITIIDEVARNGESERLNVYEGDIYTETPVDVETFFRDPYYLGRSGADMFPMILDDLLELFNGDYMEAVLCGAIGWGKSYAAKMIMCRILYEVSCLKNPQSAYGVAQETSLFFPNISINLTQAKRVIFGKIKETLRMSLYFREKFPFTPYAEYLEFPNHIMMAAVAMSGVLGMDVFAAAVDETNFMDVVEKSKQARGHKFDAAEVIYASLARRMKTRFQRQGKLPGLLIMLSSSNYDDDFTDRKKQEAKENPLIFVRDYAEWEPKPPEKYLPGRFWVSMGTENQAPEIVEDKAEAQIIKNKKIEVLEVPLDYLPDFKRDIEGALKEIAGKTKLLVNRFITQTEKIFELADAERKHPFTQTETTLVDGGKFIRELLAHQIPGSDGKLIWRPLVSPYTRRFCHIDLALTGDAAGFCAGHPKGEVQVTRRNEEYELYTEIMPIVWIDVMLRIVPPQGGEINFGNIRSLIYELQSMGFLFEKVTLDSFQSSDTIQILNGRGIKAEDLSVDTSMEPYNEVKSALYEDRLMMYWYDIVLDELKYLIVTRSGSNVKVDHLPDRSKDVSDCVAGVVYNCVEWMRNPKRQPPPAPSSGYMAGDVVGDKKAEDLGEDDWIDE